jgi:3-keto-5-aminohexanoate cleavage enzyme
MAKGFIFNFVPTGMVPMKEMTPAVPVTPEEIIDQVLNAAERGINMVHLHARETPSGIPTHKKAIYSEIIEGIRRKIES